LIRKASTGAPSPDTRPGEPHSPDAPRLSGPNDRAVFRIAAVGDLHLGTEGQGASRALLNRLVTEVEEQADLLLLCGDLTSHGRPEEAAELVKTLNGLTIPTLAVLGNHEFDAGAPAEVTRIFTEHGIRVLDGDAVEVGGVGVAGVKGFAGGFGRATLAAFGEPAIKAFVQEALDEALKLENALRRLSTTVKVGLLHYSPTPETVEGEPLEILPFLGTSRLLPPLEAMEVDVVFHGHAHTGKPEGRTPTGIPVYNVALPLLQAEGRLFRIWETPVPVPVVRP
jgi:Icc-related predicted phosphoesterase